MRQRQIRLKERQRQNAGCKEEDIYLDKLRAVVGSVGDADTK